MLSEEKSVSLNKSLFSGDELTLTASSLLVIVPVLSSVASIPLPRDKIFNAMFLISLAICSLSPERLNLTACFKAIK